MDAKTFEERAKAFGRVGASQLARLFGVDRVTVYYWVKKGMPTHENEHGNRVFDIAEARDWRINNFALRKYK